MSPRPCSTCSLPASFFTGEAGACEVYACERCRESDPEPPEDFGPWRLLVGGELEAYQRARDLETHAALTHGSVQAREVVTRKATTCGGCEAPIPARMLAVTVSAGSGSAWFSRHYCIGCEPAGVRVDRLDVARAWKLARELFARSETPEAVPGWAWERFGPVPF